MKKQVVINALCFILGACLYSAFDFKSANAQTRLGQGGWGTGGTMGESAWRMANALERIATQMEKQK